MSERSDEREELAKALCEAYCRADDSGASWAVLGDSGRAGYLAEADVAIARCARVPAEVWDVLEEMRKCDSDGVELYAVTAYAEKLEAALKSTGQEAPKPDVDVEDVSGYSITEADRRFAKDLGFVAPEVLPLHIARFREENCKRPAEPAPRITREHYDAAYQRAVDASVRGEATVKDALFRELEVGEPALRVLPTREELVDRYSRFAAGRPGAECQVAADWAIGIIREHASPADEALRSQFARLCSELNEKASRIERAERERDALRQELAEVTGQAEQVDGDLTLLRRERDEARAELEHAEQVAVDARDIFRREIEGLKAQLAVRPEPVVIDEALAARVQYAWNTAPGCDAATMLAALRSVLGEKVSVAGPESENGACVNCLRNLGEYKAAHEAWREACAERDKLRAELQLAQADISSLKYTHEAATKQLIGTQQELQAERQNFAEVDSRRVDRIQALREQHEELAAELAECRRAAEAIDKARIRAEVGWEKEREQYEALQAGVVSVCRRWTTQSNWHAAILDELRALLKPATPETQPRRVTREEFLANPSAVLERSEREPVQVMDGAELRMTLSSPSGADKTPEAQEWVNASPADALRPNDRHAQRPASEALTFAEQVERFAKLSVQPPENGAVSSRPPVPASLASLTARVERHEAALRCFLTAWDGSDPRSRPQAAQEALAMLDADKQEVGK
jgi:tetratricopeptide (TPR) repeat protein